MRIVSLDLSKAFDRANWHALCLALRDRRVSDHIMSISQLIYSNQLGERLGEHTNIDHSASVHPSADVFGSRVVLPADVLSAMVQRDLKIHAAFTAFAASHLFEDLTHHQHLDGEPHPSVISLHNFHQPPPTPVTSPHIPPHPSVIGGLCLWTLRIRRLALKPTSNAWKLPCKTWYNRSLRPYRGKKV